jgi:hypothetical protein
MKIWYTNHFTNKTALLRCLRRRHPELSLSAVRVMMRRGLSIGELRLGKPAPQINYEIGIEYGRYVYMREEGEMRVKTIDELIAEVGLPAGYERLPWAKARAGQTVWLWCQHDHKPMACGPHTVLDPKAYQLQSLKHKIKFLHYSEDLLVSTGVLKSAA